ncbi:hypothetical protein BJ165DRAFT_18050 [Panaeolus papilionaceus]|nr:hypothetical protein BJ165DRAFT_18050 [Panaeolus papilionaceus]
MSFFKISNLFLAFSIISGNLVSAAPALAADALLKNGQQAQGLNKQFLTLKATDSCTGQQISCISGAIATCVNGKWDVDTGRCAKSQDCFALPSVIRDGVEIMCTSEKNAKTLIDSTGAQGGITGDGDATPAGDGDEPLTSNSVSSTIAPTPSDAVPSSPPASSTPSLTVSSSEPTVTSTSVPASQSKINDPPSSDIPSATPTETISRTPADTTPAATGAPQVPVITVTEKVTVTVMPVVQTTLVPVTRTLSPDEVISVLSSLMAQGGSIGVPAPSSTLAVSSSSVSVAVSSDIPAATPLTDTAAASASAVTNTSASTPTPATGPYGPY